MTRFKVFVAAVLMVALASVSFAFEQPTISKPGRRAFVNPSFTYLWNDVHTLASCGEIDNSTALYIGEMAGSIDVLIAFANTTTVSTSNSISMTYELSYDGTNFFSPVRSASVGAPSGYGGAGEEFIVAGLTPALTWSAGVSVTNMFSNLWQAADSGQYAGAYYCPSLTSIHRITDTMYAPYMRLRSRNGGTSTATYDVILMGK